MTTNDVFGSAHRIIALSARSPEALLAARGSLAARLTAEPGLSVHDVSTTLAVGREQLPERWAAVVADTASAVAALRGEPAGTAAPVAEGRPATAVPPRVVLSFTAAGFEGARARGVRAYAAHGEARRWLDRAAQVLDDVLPVPLLKWFELSDDEWSDDPAMTAPAALAVDFAVARTLMSWGVTPSAATGAGVAGFTAEAAMDSLGFDDALHRVANWGRMVSEGEIDYDDSEAVEHPEDPGALVVEVSTENDLPFLLARLWCQGVVADLTTGLPGRRLRLPVYRFQRDSSSRTAPRTEPEGRPLNALEQRLVFHDLVRRSSNAEHTAVALAEVDGPVDAAALQEAFAGLQADRPALRTTFRRIGDKWRAVVGPQTARLSVRTPSVAADGGEQDAGAARAEVVREMELTAFAPTDPVLVHGLLAVGDDGRNLVGLAVHRALLPGTSAAALLEELAGRYGRRTDPAGERGDGGWHALPATTRT
ncbi:hypothetical protein [Streptomyces sp. NPDC001594]|uniref:CurL C-terminal domain-containing protein n=1 Tax=Streptomyces sp. NPDC001594 TaxID=3364590 RepID=UPI00367F8B24